MLNETDLRMQFKMNTGQYADQSFGSNNVNLNRYPYVLWLEEQLLEYQNKEIEAEIVNIKLTKDEFINLDTTL